MRNRVGVVAFVLALGLLLSACSSDNGGGSGDTSGPATTGGGGGGTTIVAQDFAFSPDSVDVSAGQVTLTVENKDSTEHTFTLDDDSSNTDLPAGETVTVTLDLSSTVGWHCTIHPSMTGTLNVS
ncbi:MAG TPA: cupredoxin domain-containing protein [Actinomycetota bacterium]|nr:cupredoxin domain-containing protein [Actinomycetota bacterium]